MEKKLENKGIKKWLNPAKQSQLRVEQRLKPCWLS